ncbi:MAG: cytochrome c [Acidobacteriota bacterium]|nr:cytochrome c [Acidobacteriota bacterium]
MRKSTSRIVGILAVGSFVVATPSTAQREYVSPETMTAEALYGLSCAACHGADGSGLHPDNPLYTSFDSPPADLSDPLFNSREPAADWAIVIKYGGAKIGLSSQMPAFGEAMTDPQIDELVTYIKSLADTERFPPGDLNFVRAVDTIKAFPEDEALIINRYVDSDEGSDSFRSTLYYGRRFGARHQGEVKLAHINRDGVSELDEAEIGWKWAIRHDLAARSLFSLGLEAAFPIADDDASEEIIPYFSFAKGLSDDFTLQTSVKALLPVDHFDDGEAKVSAILHWMRSPWPRSMTPALEATISAPWSDADIDATLIPQLYFGLSKLGHVALALGIEIPLTDLDYDYRIHSFLLWDVADGMFWDGW